MVMTNFPNGVTSFGIPSLGGGSGPLSVPGVVSSGRQGQVLFVKEGGAGDGSDPTSPLGSITAALARCNSGAGDTIFVAAGEYDENITVTKDSVSIIGMTFAGYAKPDIVATTGVVLTVEAQGFMARHCRFAGSDADTVIQSGNGFWYDDCVFDGDAGQAATEGCLRLVGLAADDSYSASEGIISNCLFRGSTSGAGIIFQHAANPSGVGTSHNQILGCRFMDNGVDMLSAVNVSGGGAGIFLRTTIRGCEFHTVGAAYVYMDMDQGAAGDLAANSALMCDNWFADEALIAAQIDISGQANVMFVGNYDAAGLVDGSTFNN